MATLATAPNLVNPAAAKPPQPAPAQPPKPALGLPPQPAAPGVLPFNAPMVNATAPTVGNNPPEPRSPAAPLGSTPGAIPFNGTLPNNLTPTAADVAAGAVGGDRSAMATPFNGQEAFTTVNPADDLRSKQITPTTSTRLKGAMSDADQAAADFTSGPSRGILDQAGFDQQMARLPGGTVTGGTVEGGPAISPADRAAAEERARSTGTATDRALQDLLAGGQGGTGDRITSEFDRARGMLGGGTSVGGGFGVDTGPSEDFRKFSTGLDSALAGLEGGPNRTQLALQTLKDFEAEGSEGLAQRFRNTGMQAAKFGRIGSGMTTNTLTDLARQNEIDNMRKRNELSAAVAEGDINDRFRKTDVYAGLRTGEEAIQAQRRSAALQGQGLNLQALSGDADRALSANTTALDQANRTVEREGDRDFRTLEAVADLEAQQANRAAGFRDEERGERDFRTSLDERNLDRRIGLDERNLDRETNRVESATGRGERVAANEIGDRFTKAGFSADREAQIRGDERTDRNEFRDERDFQDRQADQSIDRQIEQRRLEEDIKNSEFGRELSRFGAASEIAQLLNTQGAQGLRDAGMSTDMIAGLMDIFAQNKQTGGAATPIGTPVGGPPLPAGVA